MGILRNHWFSTRIHHNRVRTRYGTNFPKLRRRLEIIPRKKLIHVARDCFCTPNGTRRNSRSRIHCQQPESTTVISPVLAESRLQSQSFFFFSIATCKQHDTDDDGCWRGVLCVVGSVRLFYGVWCSWFASRVR